MNEHEQRIRDTLHELRSVMGATSDRIAKELTAALSRTRTEALEEAARDLRMRADAAEEVGGIAAGGVWRNAESAIRALAKTPTPASIPVERVREEMVREFGPDSLSVAAVFERLGVPFDATEDDAAIARGEARQTYWTGAAAPCLVCGESGQHKMSCRQTERNATGQRHHADRGTAAVITGATRGSCVSCSRDTINGICLGCHDFGSECVCAVTS